MAYISSFLRVYSPLANGCRSDESRGLLGPLALLLKDEYCPSVAFIMAEQVLLLSPFAALFVKETCSSDLSP
jgi:hypothetical protein